MADKQKLNNAVKLTTDISGGLGKHSKGTVLENLSPTVRDMLIQSGQAKAVESATGDVVDATTLTTSAISNTEDSADAKG